MSETLTDQTPSLTDFDTSWIRTPYGLKLAPSPEQAFKNWMQQQEFILGEDMNYEEAHGVEKWMDILKSKNNSENDIENRDGIAEGDGEANIFYTKPNYTDTRVGGNDAINPYWQFGIDDDIAPFSLSADGQAIGNPGDMGRVYSETYDAHQQILWMSCGVPEYVNLISFYMDAGNSTAARAMNRGTLKGIGGTIINLVFKATVWCFTWPALAPFWLFRFCTRLQSDRITTYFYFRPTMVFYYEMVNTMMSYLAVSMGLYPMIVSRRADSTKDLKKEYSQGTWQKGTGAADSSDADISKGGATRAAEAEMMRRIEQGDSGIPDLLKHGPDIFVIINRRARLFKASRVAITTRQLLKATMLEDQDNGDPEGHYLRPNNEYIHGKTKDKTDVVADRNDKTDAFDEAKEGWGGKFFSSLNTNMFGAGDFVGFKMERGVSASESVSNSTKPLGIAEKLNSYAQSKREKYEQFGNSYLTRFIGTVVTAPNTLFSDMVGQLAGMLAETFGLGDIGAIMTNGNGFIDIPEVWSGSTFQRSYSVNITLAARYGDPVSIFQSVYIPLLMLLAAALPRAVGNSMYTSPFLVKCFVKGMFTIPCGIITQMSINRGGDQYGWNSDMLPTKVEVSLNIQDLSPTFFLSMQDIGLFDTFTRNDKLMEYLDTLSAIGLYERMCLYPKMIRKLNAALLIKRNTIASPTYWGMRLGKSPIMAAVASVLPYSNLDRNTTGYYANRK